MKTTFPPFAILAATFSIALISNQTQAQTTKQKKANSLSSKSPMSLQKVRVLYANRWRGDAGFARRLQREMSEMGFVWTRDAKRADALVEASTSWTRSGFKGELWLRDRNGKLLWHETAFRPSNSNRMASARLADKLRAAMRKR